MGAQEEGCRWQRPPLLQKPSGQEWDPQAVPQPGPSPVGWSRVTQGHRSAPTWLRGRHWSKCTAPSSLLPRCEPFFSLPSRASAPGTLSCSPWHILGPRSQITPQVAITHPPHHPGRSRCSCPRCWCRCRSPDTPSPVHTHRYLRAQRGVAPGEAFWHPVPSQSQPSSPEQCLPSPVRPGGQGPQPVRGSQPTPGKHPWAQGSGGCWQKGPEKPSSHLQAASCQGDGDIGLGDTRTDG